jgi:hypothetical protein
MIFIALRIIKKDSSENGKEKLFRQAADKEGFSWA